MWWWGLRTNLQEKKEQLLKSRLWVSPGFFRDHPFPESEDGAHCICPARRRTSSDPVAEKRPSSSGRLRRSRCVKSWTSSRSKW
jgi:hypothetical protein